MRADASLRSTSGRRGHCACQTLVMAGGRPRRVQVQPFPSNRRLVTAGLRAGRRMVPMYGLIDVDVTKRTRKGHENVATTQVSRARRPGPQRTGHCPDRATFLHQHLAHHQPVDQDAQHPQRGPAVQLRQHAPPRRRRRQAIQDLGRSPPSRSTARLLRPESPACSRLAGERVLRQMSLGDLRLCTDLRARPAVVRMSAAVMTIHGELRWRYHPVVIHGA